MDSKLLILSFCFIGFASCFLQPNCMYPRFTVHPMKCCNFPAIIAQQDYQQCLDEVMRAGPSQGLRPGGQPGMQQPPPPPPDIFFEADVGLPGNSIHISGNIAGGPGMQVPQGMQGMQGSQGMQVPQGMQGMQGMQGSPDMAGFMMRGCCVSECLMKKWGIVSNNNMIDTGMAITKLTSNLTSPWTNIVRDGINFCADEVKKMESSGNFTQYMSKAPPTNQKICHPVSAYFAGCVTGRMYKSCPAPNIKDSELGCREVNDFVDRCGYILPYESPI